MNPDETASELPERSQQLPWDVERNLRRLLKFRPAAKTKTVWHPDKPLSSDWDKLWELTYAFAKALEEVPKAQPILQAQVDHVEQWLKQNPQFAGAIDKIQELLLHRPPNWKFHGECSIPIPHDDYAIWSGRTLSDKGIGGSGPPKKLVRNQREYWRVAQLANDLPLCVNAFVALCRTAGLAISGKDDYLSETAAAQAVAVARSLVPRFTIDKPMASEEFWKLLIPSTYDRDGFFTNCSFFTNYPNQSHHETADGDFTAPANWNMPDQCMICPEDRPPHPSSDEVLQPGQQAQCICRYVAYRIMCPVKTMFDVIKGHSKFLIEMIDPFYSQLNRSADGDLMSYTNQCELLDALKVDDGLRAYVNPLNFKAYRGLMAARERLAILRKSLQNPLPPFNGRQILQFVRQSTDRFEFGERRGMLEDVKQYASELAAIADSHCFCGSKFILMCKSMSMHDIFLSIAMVHDVHGLYKSFSAETKESIWKTGAEAWNARGATTAVKGAARELCARLRLPLRQQEIGIATSDENEGPVLREGEQADYGTFIWCGKAYYFNKTQAPIVKKTSQSLPARSRVQPRSNFWGGQTQGQIRGHFQKTPCVSCRHHHGKTRRLSAKGKVAA